VLGQWGKGKPRVLAKNWTDPVKWNNGGHVCVECGKSTHGDTCFHGQCKGKTHRPTVFPSLCDWLDDEVPVEWLARFLQLIHDTPNLNWLLLTKRPENFKVQILGSAFYLSGYRDGQTSENPTQPPMSAWEMAYDWAKGTATPRNVWVGTSVEDQTRADQRIPDLLTIPASGWFLSCEPLLAELVLNSVRPKSGCIRYDVLRGRKYHEDNASLYTGSNRIDWVIIGGESGPGARPCNVGWIRSLVRQCDEAGVPTFVKQLGAMSVMPSTVKGITGAVPIFPFVKHRKGGDPGEWPDDLKIREFPEGLR
jgi:protein gp37